MLTKSRPHQKEESYGGGLLKFNCQ